MRKAKDEKWRKFQTESDARAFLLDQLASHFDFTEEVAVRGPYQSDNFRIDAIGVCRSKGYILGWELKRSHLFKSEFGKALKQAADYRDAEICDTRLPELTGKRLHACIVFPDWDGLHDNGEYLYRQEAEGMRLMASYFRVGSLAHRDDTQLLHILLGEQAIWHSDRGWTGNAEGVLRGKRQRGSVRRLDASSGRLS